MGACATAAPFQHRRPEAGGGEGHVLFERDAGAEGADRRARGAGRRPCPSQPARTQGKDQDPGPGVRGGRARPYWILLAR
jgi:hypothetical protein